ncbi:hypothetical protein AQUCO_02500217v1 [Aquilegia coerulea]|uniref:Gibberellin regulated protein n=1 Tax=Aquilegia coerulea TaxID=218851 RepID=A0A2G5DA12_AQUCA|nr:hypothetical protein AQUCO_02500217v1 [Aquilegia coerulea]
MAFKAILFLVATFLLISTKVSSNEEESFLEAAILKPPVKAPVLAPAPAPAGVSYPKFSSHVNIKECPGLCKIRCSLHSRPRHCCRVCETCCGRCKCVPPGTYGNKEMCGKCYTDMKTHGDKPKCP